MVGVLGVERGILEPSSVQTSLVGDHEPSLSERFGRIAFALELDTPRQDAFPLAVLHGYDERSCVAAVATERKVIDEGRPLRPLGNALDATSDGSGCARGRGRRCARSRGRRCGRGRGFAPRGSGTEDRDRNEDVGGAPHRVLILRARRANRSRSGATKLPPVSISTASSPSLVKSCLREATSFFIV